MRKLWAGLALLVLLLVVASEGRSEEPVRKRTGETLMRVYFVPFQIHTLVPITMSDIEEESWAAIWFVKEHPSGEDKDHPFILRLHTLLQSRPTPEKIDDRVIRLKVEFRNETFYADRRGVVLEKNSGRGYRLTSTDMEEIGKATVSFRGVIDVKASRSVVLSR